MKKITTLRVTLLLISLFLVSCSSLNKPADESNIPSQSPIVEPTGSAAPQETKMPVDPIQEQISRMTIQEKIGQMVIVGLEGTTMQATAREMIEKYRIGGFILYKDNIANAAQTLALLNQLKDTNSTNGTPLWLSVDQEGGRVDRLSSEFMKLPTARKIGTVNDTSYTNQVGKALGIELQAIGFNMNYAPVLDINSNPKNPVIGDRSFGADADIVIRHGIEIMDGIRSQQIASVVKHFPGHGDTSVDSHLDLPIVEKSMAELKQFELLPFAEAIQKDVDAVMVAHLLLPQLDANKPASISHHIITGLLRESMKYDGVIITDDMTMGGITKHHSIGEAAVQSIQAGSDIVLVGHDNKLQLEVLQALNKSAEDGTLTAARLDESVYRILSLKKKYELNDTPVKSIDVQDVNNKMKSLFEMK